MDCKRAATLNSVRICLYLPRKIRSGCSSQRHAALSLVCTRLPTAASPSYILPRRMRLAAPKDSALRPPLQNIANMAFEGQLLSEFDRRIHRHQSLLHNDPQAGYRNREECASEPFPRHSIRKQNYLDSET